MSGPLILLVDDDPDDCFIFSQVLRESVPEANITCLPDCRSLLNYLQTSNASVQRCIVPDMVFLDLNMPGMTGQECLKKLKENQICRNVPIIVYSTASRPEIIEECRALGASLYIIKPSNPNELRQTISLIIKTLKPAE